MSQPEETKKKGKINLEKFVDENSYKIRDCEIYEKEYKECKCLKGRFQQWFLYGEYLDCSSWKEDIKNCNKFFSKNDLVAAASVIQHENGRICKRLEAHSANDIWEKRTEPPANWDSKLPDWLEKKQADAFKQQAYSENSCVIS